MNVNKKGAELSLNFIIIAAIGLVVLVIALVFFTGGAERLVGGVPQTVQIPQQQLNLWRSQCETYCSLGNEASFCKTYNWIDVNKDGKEDENDKFYTCSERKFKINVKDVNGIDLGVKCDKITCPTG